MVLAVSSASALKLGAARLVMTQADTRVDQSLTEANNTVMDLDEAL